MAVATRQEIARLFAVGAFGASSHDLDTWTRRPYEEAVDHLLAARDHALEDAQRAMRRTAGPLEGALSLQRAQGWWLERMRATTAPLTERMTLLWHDHLATGLADPFPDVDMLLGQNALLRSHALGNVRDLLVSITTDPAMLWWLNGVHSAVPHPNENYARELMELYALGRAPQIYSETDVREAARALTGWVVDGSGRAAFDTRRHDTGTKQVLGRAISNMGEREHEALVDHLLAQPVASRFIASKIVRGLAHDWRGDDLQRAAPELVVLVADALRAHRWDIAPALRALFMSSAFRRPRRDELLVRSPVEMAVHMTKALGLTCDDDSTISVLHELGQQPFAPPSVAGWPKGEAWLSASAALSRYKLAWVISQRWAAMPQGARAEVPAAGDIDAWADFLGAPSLTAATRRQVTAYLRDPDAGEAGHRQAGVLLLLATSPDWTVL